AERLALAFIRLAEAALSRRIVTPLRLAVVRLLGERLCRPALFLARDQLDHDPVAVGSARQRGETLGDISIDLDLGLLVEDPDRADLVAGDLAAPAQHRQQLARIGAVLAADIEAEPDRVATRPGLARSIRVGIVETRPGAVARPSIV